jgi:hypothetical protein
MPGIDVTGGSAQAVAGAAGGMSSINPYIQMAQGGFQMYSDIKGRIDDAKNWTADIPGIQKDSRGRPSYNLGEARNKLNEIDTSSFNDGAITNNILNGALGVGFLPSFLGGEKANSEAEKSYKKEEAIFGQKQDNFNVQNAQYDANEDARAAVQARSRERQRRASIIG